VSEYRDWQDIYSDFLEVELWLKKSYENFVSLGNHKSTSNNDTTAGKDGVK
jgi:hypothetical protein